MANADTPYGLRAVKPSSGCIRTNEYLIASGQSGSIFRGDVVKLLNTGTVGIAAAGDAAVLGVFAGCHYTNSDGKPKWANYWPSATVAADAVAFVYDDPHIVYQVQSDATGVAAADIGQLADIQVVAGSTVYGNSKSNLDMSAGGATTAKTLRILRLVNSEDNAAGAYADVEVVFAEHVLSNVVSGVGGI